MSQILGGLCPLKGSFLFLFSFFVEQVGAVGDFSELITGYCADLTPFQLQVSGFDYQIASFFLQR
jgi:hypothetical protein